MHASHTPPAPLLLLSIAGFPRAPYPFIAALLAPFAWVYGRPDLFDSYSVGVLLLQVCMHKGAAHAMFKAVFHFHDPLTLVMRLA